ncbi:hypothetical protein CCR97_04270 [Rhodoplanes elegans]|uniref:DUF6874 domain-containing protein n=1 Tax=Rhodoplanes elegans TaxID=29408 RepID=A0A327KFB8_9BRAD|nr:hypothetical protein [Rhodoplanes elegans]MBK5957425.1 hypothetical protein [Rhodoplanes elegans]RAI37479.1 hypothetical protein CH338_16000 [Rhodoplanes elegans]
MTTPNRKRDLPSFQVSAVDAIVIRKIARRAWKELQAARHHDRFSQLDVQMDVTATHANGCPLRLEALLAADGFNFAHDILGLRKHLDRSTGALMNCFRPRFARKEGRS